MPTSDGFERFLREVLGPTANVPGDVHLPMDERCYVVGVLSTVHMAQLYKQLRRIHNQQTNGH